MPMFRRGRLGWLRHDVDGRDLDENDMALATSDLPDDYLELKAYEPPIIDQRNTNSCLGQAAMGAIGNKENQAGIPYVQVSAAQLYHNARRNRKPTGILTDGGSYLRDMAKVMARQGVCSNELWPFHYDNAIKRALVINKRPNFRAQNRGYNRAGGKYFFILSSGDQRTLAVKAAVVGHDPVIFGVRVDRGFARLQDQESIAHWPGPNADWLGGHAMVIIGYMQHPTHGLLFLVRNSWGEDYGDHGYVWMTEEYIHEAMPQMIVVRDWRGLQEAA